MRRRCDIGRFDDGADSLILDEYGPQQRRERDCRSNLVGVREIDEDWCVDSQ